MNATKCPLCGTIYLGFSCPSKDCSKNELPKDISDIFGDIFR